MSYAGLVHSVRSRLNRVRLWRHRYAMAQQWIGANMSDPLKGEHSDRGRYVTDQVKLWIANDGEERPNAEIALHVKSVRGLREQLVMALMTGDRYSAPWQVARELAPNDYARINWYDVAAELKGE